jgi:hypothetical protein
MTVTIEQSATRTRVVAALDGLQLTVGDQVHTVHAYPTMPPAPQPLDAFLLWDRTEWINHVAQRTTWVVIVLAPQGMPKDAALDDALASAVGGALLSQIGGVIDRAEPVGVRLQEGAGPTVPAISITYVV